MTRNHARQDATPARAAAVWTPARVADFRARWDAGEATEALARRYHVAPPYLRQLASAFGFPRRKNMKLAPPPTTRRPCLMCRRPFDSEGAHNRICGECKKTHAWREGGDGTATEGGRVAPLGRAE